MTTLRVNCLDILLSKVVNVFLVAARVVALSPFTDLFHVWVGEKQECGPGAKISDSRGCMLPFKQ